MREIEYFFTFWLKYLYPSSTECSSNIDNIEANIGNIETMSSILL